VAATTFLASISPADVFAWKPPPSAFFSNVATATPQRIGALICSA
jgi:hypothetical protein